MYGRAGSIFCTRFISPLTHRILGSYLCLPPPISVEASAQYPDPEPKLKYRTAITLQRGEEATTIVAARLLGSNSNCSAHAGGRRHEAESGWRPRVDESARQWISPMLTLVASSSSPCTNAPSILHLPLATMAMLTPTCASPSQRLIGYHGHSPRSIVASLHRGPTADAILTWMMAVFVTKNLDDVMMQVGRHKGFADWG